MGAFRRYLRGWVSHNNSSFKQKKLELQSTISFMDVAAEVRDLTEVEREQLDQSRDQLTSLLREEEIKYYQRAKTKDVLLGDNNMRYFQMIANGKHRKKRIFSLDDANGKIEGQQILNHTL